MAPTVLPSSWCDRPHVAPILDLLEDVKTSSPFFFNLLYLLYLFIWILKGYYLQISKMSVYKLQVKTSPFHCQTLHPIHRLQCRVWHHVCPAWHLYWWQIALHPNWGLNTNSKNSWLWSIDGSKGRGKQHSCVPWVYSKTTYPRASHFSLSSNLMLTV